MTSLTHLFPLLYNLSQYSLLVHQVPLQAEESLPTGRGKRTVAEGDHSEESGVEDTENVEGLELTNRVAEKRNLLGY